MSFKANYTRTLSGDVNKDSSTKSNLSFNLPAGMDVLYFSQEYKKDKGFNETWQYLDFLTYEITRTGHLDYKLVGDAVAVGNSWDRRPFVQHFIDGYGYAMCPRSNGQKCPICEYFFQDKRWERDPAVKAIAPKNFCAAPILHPTVENAVAVFVASQKGFFDELRKDIKIVMRDAGNDHPALSFPEQENGATVGFFLEEATGGSFKFMAPVRWKYTPRKPIADVLWNQVPKLDEVIVTLSYPELVDILHTYYLDTREYSGDADEPVQEAPRKSREDITSVGDLPDGFTPVASRHGTQSTTTTGQCPHNYTFGTSFEHAECDACDVFKECSRARKNR